MPDAKVVWFEPSASKRWMVAFGSGSTPRLPEEPTPTNKAPVFGIDGQMPVLVALDDAEYAFLGDHLLRRLSAGDRLALVGWHLVDALLSRSPAPEGAENVRHAPDAILVGDQHVAHLARRARTAC